MHVVCSNINSRHSASLLYRYIFINKSDKIFQNKPPIDYKRLNFLCNGNFISFFSYKF